MTKEIVPSRVYREFLKQFIDEGINKIPYNPLKIHKAFSNILKEYHDLTTKWELQQSINPYCGRLEKIMNIFNAWEITSIDDLLNPQNIVILDMAKYNEQPSKVEIKMARRIKEDYLKLIA